MDPAGLAGKAPTRPSPCAKTAPRPKRRAASVTLDEVGSSHRTSTDRPAAPGWPRLIQRKRYTPAGSSRPASSRPSHCHVDRSLASGGNVTSLTRRPSAAAMASPSGRGPLPGRANWVAPRNGFGVQVATWQAGVNAGTPAGSKPSLPSAFTFCAYTSGAPAACLPRRCGRSPRRRRREAGATCRSATCRPEVARLTRRSPRRHPGDRR